jgi:hypothetical protein
MTEFINACKSPYHGYDFAIAELKAGEDLIFLAGSCIFTNPVFWALTNERLFEIKWKKTGLLRAKLILGREIPLNSVKKVGMGSDVGYDGASDLILGAGSSGVRAHPFVLVSTENVDYKLPFDRDDCSKIVELIGGALPLKTKSINASPRSIATEIQKLKQLLDEGVLSSEEFQKAKENLLGK